MDLIITVFFILAIATAVFSLEAENRLVSIVFLMATTTLIGLLFLYVNALFVGVFQLLVYSGVLTVLFASSSYFLESYPVKEGDVGSIEVNMNE